MSIKYRTTGAWGTGNGVNLTAPEIDNNFYYLDSKIKNLEAGGIPPVTISNITATNNKINIYLTNGTVLGPYILPYAEVKSRGDWEPETDYNIGDIVSVPFEAVTDPTKAGFYFIGEYHTSTSNFNPNLVVGEGLAYVQLSQFPFVLSLTPLVFSSDVIPAASLVSYNGDTYFVTKNIVIPDEATLTQAVAIGQIINLTNIGTLSFNDLSDVQDYSSEFANKYLKVNDDATGIEYGIPKFEECLNGPGPFAGNAGKILRVNADANRVEYSVNSFVNLTDTPNLYGSQAGKLLAINSSGTGLEFVSGFGGAFVSLTDVPTTYSGSAGKYVAVNSTATALEFISPPSFAFTNLTDVPQSYTNQENKYVAVNSAGTGLEFVTTTLPSPLTYLTAQNPTSGTFVEFQNIPNTARRIHIHFAGIRLSGTSDYVVQLGNSSGYIATGYTSTYSYLRTSANGSLGTITTGFAVGGGTTLTLHGTLSLVLCDSTTRLWTESYVMAGISGSNYFTYQGGGSKSFGSGVDVTKIKIASNNGSDTFAAGTINVSYEL